MEQQRITPSPERITAIWDVLLSTSAGRELMRDLGARGVNVTGNRAPALSAQTELTLKFNNMFLADDIHELCQMARPNDSLLQTKQRADAIRDAMLVNFDRDIAKEIMMQSRDVPTVSTAARTSKFVNVAAPSPTSIGWGANPSRRFASMAERPAGVGVMQFISQEPVPVAKTAPPPVRLSALAPH